MKENELKVCIALFLGLSVTACDSSNDSTTSTATTTETEAALASALNDQFEAEGLAQAITVVDCTLSSGVETRCYSITAKGAPGNRDIGPFCPRTIEASADEVGVWLDGGVVDTEVHDLDGAFITNLANRYGDNNWLLYDVSSGAVNYTATFEGCQAAARPDVDPAYQNYCVECSLDDMGGPIETTYLIPVTPVPLDSPASLSGEASGVTLDGVGLALPAPVADILGNYTIAAFDDCGGHVNTVAGYHYHAAMGCSDQAQSDGHAGLIGYARDGYGIYAMLDAEGNEHSDLDECRGTTDSTRGYHYHAASAGENMFIGCFHGDSVTVEEDRPAPPQ